MVADFDPEDNAGHPEAGEASSSSGEDLDAMAAREHYADVGYVS